VDDYSACAPRISRYQDLRCVQFCVCPSATVIQVTARTQVLRRFGKFMRIKLDPSPRVEDLVLLELKAELIAGSLQVRPQVVCLCRIMSTLAV